MKIFDAIYTAAVLLGLDSLTDSFNSEDFDLSEWRERMSGDDLKEAEILLKCCNLVLCELSETGFPLKTESKLVSTDGRIGYDSFPEKVSDVYAVYAGRKKVPFREFYDCITVPESGEFKILYSFEPQTVNLGDLSPYGGNKPSARLLAYGIAREYCLISGMTDDAGVWDGRFNACAEDESAVRRERKIRARIWR